MEENMGKKVSKICIEAKDKMETTAEAWVFVGTDSTNHIDTSWVYVKEEENVIPKIIWLMALLAVAGQKIADAILQTGGITEDELKKIVEKAMKLIKQREGETKKC